MRHTANGTNNHFRQEAGSGAARRGGDPAKREAGKGFATARRTVVDQLLLLLLTGILYTAFLGDARLWDWDEAINASTAREMLVRNDWVVPWFNGAPNFNKPIMVTLGIILSYSVFGVTEFAARLPSALWSIGTVLLTYRIGLYLFNRPIAFRAAFVLGTMLLFCVEARAATPDAVLIFWCTAAFYCYVAGTIRPKSPEEWEEEKPPVLRYEGEYYPRSLRFLIPMYGMMGVAVLAKGPVGFLLPSAVIGMFLLLKRLPSEGETANRASLVNRLMNLFRPFDPPHFLKTCLSMRLLLGLAVILAVAAPWYVWVGVKTNGDWPRVFLLSHNVGRALAPMEGHKGPFYYYLAAILFDTFPWSVFFIAVVVDTVKRLRQPTPPWSDGLVFSLCWAGVIMLAFSCAATKLPNYIATMFPAAAFVYAVFLYHWSKNTELVPKSWTVYALGTLTLVGFILTAILLILPDVTPRLLPGERVLAVVGAIPAVGGLVCFGVWKWGTRPQLETTLNCAFVLFLAVLFFWGAGRVSKHQRYVEMFAAVRAANPGADFAILNSLEPSWVFYRGTPMEVLRPLDVEAFLEKKGENGYILAREHDFAELKKQTKTPFRIVATASYLLRQKDLVIFTPEENKNRKGSSLPPE